MFWWTVSHGALVTLQEAPDDVRHAVSEAETQARTLSGSLKS